MTNRGGIKTMLYLLDEAFRASGMQEGDESPALLPNLATVPEEIWRSLPPGGARSIESIALHVAECKVMYDDYAFGSGMLDWDTPEVHPWSEGEAPMAETLRWLETVQKRLEDHVAALADDSELDRLRPSNWGDERPTRWLIAVLINHDAYHAGEINHLRSILGPDDRWQHVKLGYG